MRWVNTFALQSVPNKNIRPGDAVASLKYILTVFLRYYNCKYLFVFNGYSVAMLCLD